MNGHSFRTMDLSFKAKGWMPAVLAVALLNAGCGRVLLPRGFSEGVIEYALTFPDQDPNGLMTGMLPETTTLTFSNDRQVAELSAGMGLFRTTLVSDNETHELKYYLTIMSKKISALMRDHDMMGFTQDYGAMVMVETNEVDTIAGFPCRKAIGVFSNIGAPEIEVFYTDQIDLDSPNWFGPFQQIPGVLLRYDIVQYGMRMHFDAVTVRPGPVDQSKFDVRPDHQQVTPEALDNELKEILGSFSM